MVAAMVAPPSSLGVVDEGAGADRDGIAMIRPVPMLFSVPVLTCVLPWLSIEPRLFSVPALTIVFVPDISPVAVLSTTLPLTVSGLTCEQLGVVGQVAGRAIGEIAAHADIAVVDDVLRQRDGHVAAGGEAAVVAEFRGVDLEAVAGCERTPGVHDVERLGARVGGVRVDKLEGIAGRQQTACGIVHGPPTGHREGLRGAHGARLIPKVGGADCDVRALDTLIRPAGVGVVDSGGAQRRGVAGAKQAAYVLDIAGIDRQGAERLGLAAAVVVGHAVRVDRDRGLSDDLSSQRCSRSPVCWP